MIEAVPSGIDVDLADGDTYTLTPLTVQDFADFERWLNRVDGKPANLD